MSETFGVPELAWLVRAYFSDPDRRRELKKGDVLLEQGVANDCLYLVLRGSFGGYVRTAEEKEYELFEATRNMFVGVQSFFSRTFVSRATVIAREDSTVAWIDQRQETVEDGQGRRLFEQFMPVVVANLSWRHQREQELAVEKADVLRRLVLSEKLASLGQMAAGIAHELNNAVAVLSRDAEWLRDWLAGFLKAAGNPNLASFERGALRGRTLSSREVRQKARELASSHSLPEDAAFKAAEMDLPADALDWKGPDRLAEIRDRHEYWEIGATFHDMAAAAELATDVVQSVRVLASPRSEREGGLDVNESIREALSLLRSPLRLVQVDLDLGALPFLRANKSELVQVWTNLVRNATESLENSKQTERRIGIASRVSGGSIVVKVRDNGPGIAPENVPRIFQPNFTTREKGLDFGLGLGLPIVERIVHTYGGSVSVESEPGATVFTIQLPWRGEHGKADNHLPG